LSIALAFTLSLPNLFANAQESPRRAPAAIPSGSDFATWEVVPEEFRIHAHAWCYHGWALNFWPIERPCELTLEARYIAVDGRYSQDRHTLAVPGVDRSGLYFRIPANHLLAKDEIEV